MAKFFVAVHSRDPSDSHAGRTQESALDTAIFDPGTHYDLWLVEAADGGAARLPAVYRKGKLVGHGRTSYRNNPAAFTPKEERQYRHIKRSYQARGEPRAKEIAARTVLARRNPKAKAVAIDDTSLNTWFERDRSHLELRDARTDKTILEFWDDDVQQLVEDGFLDPRDWHGSIYDYAVHLGVIKGRR